MGGVQLIMAVRVEASGIDARAKLQHTAPLWMPLRRFTLEDESAAKGSADQRSTGRGEEGSPAYFRDSHVPVHSYPPGPSQDGLQDSRAGARATPASRSLPAPGRGRWPVATRASLPVPGSDRSPASPACLSPPSPGTVRSLPAYPLLPVEWLLPGPPRRAETTHTLLGRGGLGIG